MIRLLVVLPALAALVTGCSSNRTGLLVMAHGGSPEWNQQVKATVAPLDREMPTEIALGMASPSTIQAAIRRLEARGVDRIKVVRLFISGESFLESTEFIMGLREDLPGEPYAATAVVAPGGDEDAAAHSHRSMQGDTTDASASAPEVAPASSADSTDHAMEAPWQVSTDATIVLSREGIADSPLVDQILLDRVGALSEDPSNESVLILGHGPGDDAENERWLAKMQQRAQAVHRLGAFRRVQCETLREDWPEKRAEAQGRIRRFVEDGSRNGGRVIVVPFRVAGFGPYREVLEGLTYTADGRGLCPHPNLTHWIRQTAQALPEGGSQRAGS